MIVRCGIGHRTVAKRILLIAAAAAHVPLVGHVAMDGPAPIGVVLITLDATRADRLTSYGLMDAAMPGLERLAREGVQFNQVASVAPLTLRPTPAS